MYIYIYVYIYICRCMIQTFRWSWRQTTTTLHYEPPPAIKESLAVLASEIFSKSGTRRPKSLVSDPAEYWYTIISIMDHEKWTNTVHICVYIYKCCSLFFIFFHFLRFHMVSKGFMGCLIIVNLWRHACNRRSRQQKVTLCKQLKWLGPQSFCQMEHGDAGLTCSW